LYPTSALPHLNIDNKSLKSHNEPERTREYVDFKRVMRKSLGARQSGKAGLNQNQA